MRRESCDQGRSSLVPNGTSCLPIAALIALALLAACSNDTDWPSIKETIRAEFSAVPQMSVGELATRYEQDLDQMPLVVDTRAPEEYAVSHLPGALNATGEQLRELAQMAPERDIVLYCSVGYRSSSEARALIEQGYGNVFNLEGSIFEWANSGHPVYRGDAEVEAVHPYDEEWGRLLDSRLHSYGAD